MDYEKFVCGDGTLNHTQFFKAERLNRYQNDTKPISYRVVTYQTNSVIYKPFRTKESLVQELWIETRLASDMAISIPEILHSHCDETANLYWLFREDLGTLTHTMDLKTYTQLVEGIVSWHRIPVSELTTSQTPYLPKMHDFVLLLKDRVDVHRTLFSEHHLPIELLVRLQDGIRTLERFPRQDVVSHGDLHRLNVAWAKDRLYVLDWELLQTNSYYWDLYTLLDNPSPDFPTETTPEVRNTVLELYWERQKDLLQCDVDTFIKGYHWYAACYGVLVASQIVGDMESQRFPKEALEQELRDVRQLFLDCLPYLES